MSRDDAETPDPERDEERALDLQIAEYLRLGVPLATVACAIPAGLVGGAPAVLLVLAGGVLVTVIAVFWASIRTLVGETPLSGADAYALGAPRAAEEQKRAVLRALKDLEFERSVGKISEEDYEGLVAKYRAEAKRLLRTIDEDAQPERTKVETLVNARLHREGLLEDPGPVHQEAPKGAKPTKKKASKAGAPPKKKEEPKPEASVREEAREEEPKPPPAEPEAVAERVACAACGTKNDPDAVFCKKCGARQGAASEDDEEGDEPVKDEEATS